jgi:hypothetical protein
VRPGLSQCGRVDGLGCAQAEGTVIDGEAVWLDLMANLDLNQRTDLDRTTM